MAVTTSEAVTCPGTFFQISEGYFLRTDWGNEKNWTDAEAECQTYGNHVHLVTVDTQQVLLMSLLFLAWEHSPNNTKRTTAPLLIIL